MEDLTKIPLEMVIVVVSVALLTGMVMIGAVLRQYVFHRWFHMLGGPVLTGFGTALIGLTVYGNVSLKVGDFEAEINSLRASLEERNAQVEHAKAGLRELGKKLTVARIRSEESVAILRSSKNFEEIDPQGVAELVESGTFVIELVESAEDLRIEAQRSLRKDAATPGPDN